MSDAADAQIDATEAPAPAAAGQVPAAPPAEGIAPPAEGQTPAPGEAPKAEGDAPAEAEAFTLAPPEGAEAFSDDFAAFSADMDGWLKANPNASARDALAEAANRQARLASEAQTSFAQQREAQMAEWGDALKADKEFGGEKFDQNLATAIKGVEAVGSPELRALLDETGMGSHPEIVRAFWKVGQLTADAPFATGAQGAQPAKSLAERMYPNMRKD